LEMERYESLLQQRGPPTSPIASSALAVILCDNPKFSPPRGVEPVIIETNIPALIPAPQAPQKPQAPPSNELPLRFISIRDLFRSISPPQFLYAVSSAIPTMT